MADSTVSKLSGNQQIAMGAGGAVGGILGGIMGSNAGSGDMGEARNQVLIAQQILDEISQAPDISKPLILEKYKQQGVLTPEMEANITAQEPAAISTDSKYKDLQSQALDQLQQRASGGLTAADRAALQDAQSSAQGGANSQIQSIQQKMQQQGLADSGSSLAMKLSAAQQGANNQSANANAIAQQSQQGRDQALSQLGNLANQSQSQQFGQQYQQQQARSEMQRFNVGNQISQQQRNVGAANNAQAANLANAQNVSNMNTNSQNQEQNSQLGRQMQQYNANVGVAQIKSGGHQQLGSQLSGMGQQEAQNGYNMGNGIGQMAGAAAAFLNQGGQVHNYKAGGSVSGKAPVNGDSPANDIVHAMLSPGEIVIPRTLAESKFGKHILKVVEAHNNLKKHVNGEE